LWSQILNADSAVYEITVLIASGLGHGMAFMFPDVSTGIVPAVYAWEH